MTPRKKKTEPTSAAQETMVTAESTPEVPAVVDGVEDELACELAPDQIRFDEDALTAVSIVQQMVAFHLGGQRYALPIRGVQEIQQIVALSEAHGGSAAVIGMVNLRGSVIPAIDMRVLLGLDKQEYRLDTPMIICRVADGFVALVVDDVEDVIDIPDGALSPPPKLHSMADRMIGVCHLETDLVFLLSVDKLVAPLGLDSRSGW